MKPSELNELIDALIEGDITEADFLRLEAEMSIGPVARKAYLDRVALTQALTAEATAASTIKAMPKVKPQRMWFSWRPLTAAAAGIVFGMFCTSVVFGFVGYRGALKKTPLAVVQPSFEDAAMPLAKGFPDASAHWGGDEARVVAAENGVSAKDGKSMLRLEASPMRMPRFVYQVLDLTSVPTTGRGETREIEISASFAAGDAGSSKRYMIRAFAVSESREALDATWLEHRDEAVASASRGLDVVGGGHGWETLGLRIQVPRAARSLVLFFGVRTPDKTVRNTAHYIDEVQVSLIEPQPIP